MFIRSHGEQGPARFKQLWKHLETMWNIGWKKPKWLDLSQSDRKIAYLTACVSILATLDSKIEQEVYAGKVAGEVGVEKSSVTAPN